MIKKNKSTGSTHTCCYHVTLHRLKGTIQLLTYIPNNHLTCRCVFISWLMSVTSLTTTSLVLSTRLHHSCFSRRPTLIALAPSASCTSSTTPIALSHYRCHRSHLPINLSHLSCPLPSSRTYPPTTWNHIGSCPVSTKSSSPGMSTNDLDARCRVLTALLAALRTSRDPDRYLSTHNRVLCTSTEPPSCMCSTTSLCLPSRSTRLPLPYLAEARPASWS